MFVYISKADTSIEIDFDSLPKAAQLHIIEYGLRQKLNDAGSQYTKKELGDEAGKLALGAAENVIEALKRGDITVRQAGKVLTLQEREVFKLVNSMYKDAFGKKAEDLEMDYILEKLAAHHKTDVLTLQAAIDKTAAKRAEIRKQEIELRNSAKEIEIEL